MYLQQSIKNNYSFNEKYETHYSELLNNAIKDDISDILYNESFNVNNEYDDISFSDKKYTIPIKQDNNKKKM